MSRPFYRTPPTVGGVEQSYDDARHTLSEPWPEQAHNTRLVAHSGLDGWGDAFQITLVKTYCYVAASGIDGHNGFTVLDVADPSKPRVVNRVEGNVEARMHKVLRINDEILVTNSEIRPKYMEAGTDVLGGLRIFDISDPVNPRLIREVRTGHRGVHRPIYDPKRQLLYSSAFKNGYRGKILLIHDMKDPTDPQLIGEAWIPGQKDGEAPSWDPEIVDSAGAWIHEGNPHGNMVCVGAWNGGIAMFDIEDPSRPKLMWQHNPHETHGWAGSYHSFLVPEGSEFGIVTQEATSLDCDHPPAHITFYDLRNVHKPLPISTFMPHEIDPVSMRPLDAKWCRTGSRYGAHNIWLDMTKDDLIYIAWFSAGLRIVDWSNPFTPKEVGYYIPAGDNRRGCPQSNDVHVDTKRGLVYMSDRWGLGLHIVEQTG